MTDPSLYVSDAMRARVAARRAAQTPQELAERDARIAALKVRRAADALARAERQALAPGRAAAYAEARTAELAAHGIERWTPVNAGIRTAEDQARLYARYLAGVTRIDL